jgi:CO/xanthine dehydrogenase Mo-binding subunit
MKHGFYRPATYNMLKGGLDRNGRLVAWMHRLVGPSSKGIVAGYAVPSYDIPHLLIDTHILETGVPIGPWRSVGASQNGFILESFIDELAHAAGADPFQFRRSLLGKAPRLKRTLEYAAAPAEWGTPLSKGRARGIACFESYGSTCAQVAEVSVDGKGKLTIHRIVVAVDCGPYVNPNTVEAQIQGAVVLALGAAIKGEITVANGGIVQSNFDDYPLLEIGEMPKVEAHIIPSEEPIGGIGEPPLPPTTAAVTNAIFAATGIRIRKLPFGPRDLKKS